MRNLIIAMLLIAGTISAQTNFNPRYTKLFKDTTTGDTYLSYDDFTADDAFLYKATGSYVNTLTNYFWNRISLNPNQNVGGTTTEIRIPPVHFGVNWGQWFVDTGGSSSLARGTVNSPFITRFPLDYGSNGNNGPMLIRVGDWTYVVEGYRTTRNSLNEIATLTLLVTHTNHYYQGRRPANAHSGEVFVYRFGLGGRGFNN